MAGHSQFKNIMHRKGRQDAQKSKLFSKLAREITVAAKMGQPDPSMNARLRAAITSEPSDFPALRAALEEAGIPMESADLALLPKTQVEVDADQARTLLRLVDALEESDDVQDVYFNFDIPDAVLEAETA